MNESPDPDCLPYGLDRQEMRDGWKPNIAQVAARVRENFEAYVRLTRTPFDEMTPKQKASCSNLALLFVVAAKEKMV